MRLQGGRVNDAGDATDGVLVTTEEISDPSFINVITEVRYDFVQREEIKAV